MKSQERRIIERHFYNYEQERNEAADYISSRAIANMGMDYSKERVQSSHTNTVEEKFVKTADEYDKMYHWCLVYEKTFERFKWTLKDKLMQMRYIDRNSEVCYCNEIGISERTARYWVEEIIQVAHMWAIEFKLL